MRVMLLVESLDIGGLPNYVLDLARALAEIGESVAVAHGGIEVPAHLDVQGVALLSLGHGGADALAHKLRGWNPDVVHVHLCSQPTLLRAIEMLQVPMLRSFHDYTSLCLRRGRRRWPGDRCQRALGAACMFQGCLLGAPAIGSRIPRLQNLPAKLHERASYQRFDAAVVGSRYMRQVLLVNGFDAERVHWVPYFSRFDAQARGAVSLTSKPVGVPGRDRSLQLMFAGQAVKGKGLRVLVRALGGLPSGANWTLTTVSAGPEIEPAQALAQRLGIAERIDFRGWVPQGELPAQYRAADLLVVPSIWDDPGPLVGLEALAMGTPVAGFPVGGIPDYALDGRTGFLAPAVSVSALRATLLRALESGAILSQLGETGRALVAAQYSRARHLEQLLKLYHQALRAPRAAAAPVAGDLINRKGRA